MKYLRTTRTSTGLRVYAHLVRKTYKTGVKVTDAQMRELHITPNSISPKWNYTVEPMSRKTEFISASTLSVGSRPLPQTTRQRPPNRAYAGALRRLDAWLGDRSLD